MYLHEIVDHHKHAHDLGLCIQIILLWESEYLEVPLQYTKDLLDHIPKPCMPEIEELFVILGPDRDRSECI